MMIRSIRRTCVHPRLVAFVIVAFYASSRPAYAQLDPLLGLKTQVPDITLLVDTTSRMQRDADEAYYDPRQYTRTGAAWEATLGVNATTTNTNGKYYRKFVGLNPPLSLLGIPLDGLLYKAERIVTVGDKQTEFATFLERTRIEVARRGVLEAVEGNMYSVRFNLLRLGQLVHATSFQTAQTVYTSAADQRPPNVANTAMEVPGTSLLGIPLTQAGWKITRNTNVVSGASVTSLLGPAIPSDAIGGNTLIRNHIANATGTTGALVPLGLGDLTVAITPVLTLLQQTLAEALRFLTGQPICKNAAIVMVVGGGEPLSINTILLLVQQLLSLILGHRVPIHIIAIAPPAGEVAFLQQLTDMTGGRYTEITKAMIDVTVPGQPVAEVVNAINWAVQHALLPPSEINKPTTLLSSAQLRNLSAEHQSTSPITGSVNLDGRADINGTLLPNTRIQTTAGIEIPQRSNVMVTSGYTIPGFAGKLRAFRSYKPELDATKPNGYRFVQDGTRLWVASTPAAASRNIFTVLQNGTMIPFTAQNASTLAPYLGKVNAADLIQRIRSQPLGAIVGSTPAIMDPPSLDPAPDSDYAFFKDLNRNRRSILFVGANDGMMHAIDGRTGVELWAFIPFNLLPKLRSLPWGHGVDAGFRYMVDSSPKLSDVKVNGEWRTYLFFGQSGGGTFYNALDVTLHRMGETIDDTADAQDALLGYFATETRIPWAWSFPRLTSFDATIAPFGDVSDSASNIEKTVGQSWSDPAVGRIGNDDAQYGVFVGSGFFPYSKQQQANRDGIVAGRTFYVLSAATGQVLASREVTADGQGENIDDCRAAGNCMRIKNALQSDPVASGPFNSLHAVTKIYLGDLDGRVWRMNVSSSSSGAVTLSTPAKLYDIGAGEPIFGSMAAVNLGANKTNIFFGTGSDLLPSTGVTGVTYYIKILQDTGGSTGSLQYYQSLERTDGSGEDEKVSSFPAVAGDIVFFSTTTMVNGACPSFNTSLYAYTFTGGPAYDTNGDGQIKTSGSNRDVNRLFTRSNARATAPFIVDQHLYLGVGGGKVEVFGDSQDFNNGVGQAGVRILSWRGVR